LELVVQGVPRQQTDFLNHDLMEGDQDDGILKGCAAMGFAV
jgi:hypothetical protein